MAGDDGPKPPSGPSFFRRVARLLLLVRSRTSPRARAIARFGLPFIFSFATVAWLRSKARSSPSVRHIVYSDFLRLVEADYVRAAAIGASGSIFAEVAPGALSFIAGADQPGVGSAATAAIAAAMLVQTQIVALPPALSELLLKKGVAFGVGRPSALGRALQTVLVVAPIVYLGVISFVLWRMASDQMGGGGGGSGSGTSGGPIEGAEGSASAPRVSFDEIGGIAHAKAQVLEVVDCLRNPLKFFKAGARCPKGLLLVGPPGTGKTLLARAIASNSSASFIACSGSDFVEVFVGRGAARVRKVFASARAAAPCVLFIDELDALGRQRGGTSGPGGGGGGWSEEHEHAVIALLAELDGFSPTVGVLAVGATNRFLVLDSALVRPGRFDRVIRLRLPDPAERAAILKVHLRRAQPELPEAALDLRQLAQQTDGLSGAELANLVNEAALCAVRHARVHVSHADFAEALRLYRSSRTFEEVSSHDGGEAEEREGPASASGLPPALLAAILHNLQLASAAAGPRATTG